MPSKLKAPLTKAVDDMAVNELSQQFQYYDGAVREAEQAFGERNNPQNAQTLYDAYATMDQFLFEVNENKTDFYARNKLDETVGRLEAARLGVLTGYGGIKRNDEVEDRFEEFKRLAREYQERERLEAEKRKQKAVEVAIERAEEERLKKEEEDRQKRVEDEHRELAKKKVAAAETGSRSPGADHQPQGHTVVTVPPTPPSSVHESGRDHALANTPSTSTGSVNVEGEWRTAHSVHQADLAGGGSSVQSMSESGSDRDDEVSSSARSSSDASILYDAQGHPRTAATGGVTPERRVISSRSSSDSSSSHDSDEFDAFDEMSAETRSSQLRAGALEAVPREPGQHQKEWHSTVRSEALDEMHKSLDGSTVDEDEHHDEYVRRGHGFPAPQESSMDFDQGEPIRVFSVPGEGRNYVEGAMRDFLSSQYQGPEEAFSNMSVSELRGRLNDKHSDVVDALSAQIEKDYREKKLKPIEGRAAPSIPVHGQAEPDEVTTYTFKGRTLTQTEHQADGKISFSAEPGLNAVVRIQRRDRLGELIEAFDTVEYKNGQVAALVMGKGGESRLADIVLMRSQIKKRGGVEFGGVEDEPELPLGASRRVNEERVRDGVSTDKEQRTIPLSAADGRDSDSQVESMAKARAEADIAVHKRPRNLGLAEEGDFAVLRSAPSTPGVRSINKRGGAQIK